MACPICNSPEGATLNEGIRAGAGVLILVSAMVIGAIVRFAIGLWREEATEGTESAEQQS